MHYKFHYESIISMLMYMLYKCNYVCIINVIIIGQSMYHKCNYVMHYKFNYVCIINV